MALCLYIELMAVDSSTAALSDYSVARVFSPHLVLSPVFAQTRFFCLCVLYDHLLFLWTWWICLKIFIQWRTVALVPLSPIRFDYCPLFSRFTLSKHSQTRDAGLQIVDFLVKRRMFPLISTSYLCLAHCLSSYQEKQ